MTALVGIMNQILHTGQVPSSWQKTMFQMLPKTKNARTTKDFHPFANIRLMYKTFAYLILGRIEEPLEDAQPEEQHGFRTKRRIEEHLLSANMVIDKTLLANKPSWILSLNLSKAFDCVDWDALWSGVREKNKGFDNSSATTEDIDDPRWFGDWCWPHRRPINVWAVCWPRLMQAHGRMILTTDYKVRPVHFMFTNGFFATKLSQWHLV